MLGFCGEIETDERLGGFRSGITFDEAVIADDDDDAELWIFLFFLEPPPTGTFLRDPPSVQYLLQVLQKYLGCVRL